MGELVTGVVGIVGVLLGLFADRILQRRGKVRCHMEPLRLSIIATDESDLTLRTLPVPEGAVNEEKAKQIAFSGDPAIRCFLEAKLFNEKEVKTGIRDVKVVFEGGGATMDLEMLDRSTWRPSSGLGRQMDYLEVVNLPSREWITLSLMGEIEVEDARELTRCDRALLRGYFPDGSRFDARVPFKPSKG